MPAIPVLSRLSLSDYARLVFAFAILIVEPVLRFVFAVLPLKWAVDFVRTRILDYVASCDAATSGGASNGSPGSGAGPRTSRLLANRRTERMFMHLAGTEDFVAFWGFPFQPHYVTTRDGYILALHRIPSSRAENTASAGRTGAGARSARQKPDVASATSARPVNATSKPIVLLWHGFLMSSEVWVCSPEPSNSLALTLADAGYDVWLGNTRGNKYSCKHKKLKPTEEKFWDFCIDQLAQFDMPDVVDYILKVTGAPSLTYIGFSQGTAQGFAGLSLSPELNKKVNLFIALAPATKPHGLENKTINSLINASPEVIYLLFGRKALLSTTLFWQSILTPATFAWIIDIACWFLFGWSADLIDYKHIVYRHLYSYSGVKIVVHWFQIMKTGRFQMYDDNPPVLPNAQTGSLVPKFPTTQIQTPIAIFYGGKDTLPDMDYIIRTSPSPVLLLKIDEYEHIHFLWGRGLDRVVYPAILGLLSEHSEVWADASPTSADADRPHVLTVPWITKREIDRLLELGKVEIRGDMNDMVVGHGSSVSVVEVLEARSQALAYARDQAKAREKGTADAQLPNQTDDMKKPGTLPSNGLPRGPPKSNFLSIPTVFGHGRTHSTSSVSSVASSIASVPVMPQNPDRFLTQASYYASFKDILPTGPGIRKPQKVTEKAFSDDGLSYEDCIEEML